MNNHGVTPDNLINALPQVLRNDKKINALAVSIARVLSSRDEETSKLLIYPRIDELPEELLDILARDFKVDWYGYNYPVEVKRKILKCSFSVHRRLGTRGAMEDVLHSLYEGTHLQEWFEYGGKPYYFRIILDIGKQPSPISHSEIVRSVNIYKPLRSRLEDDAIVYRTYHTITVKTSSGNEVYATRLCGTYPNRATQGGIEAGILDVNAAIGNTAYSVRMCGTALDCI